MKKIYFFILSFFVGFTAVFAQPASWSVTNTSKTHNVFITASVNPTINGAPMSTGDYIGVFYSKNGNLVCGGLERWTGEQIAITIFGNDETAANKNGFDTNETFVWKAWRASDGAEGQATVSYKATDAFISHQGAFADNGISELATFVATVTPSGAGSSAISAPSNLQGNALSDREISLSWKDNSNNETGFAIYIATVSAGGIFTTVGTANTNVTTYTLTNLQASTEYFVRIKAINATNQSDDSNTANITTLATGQSPVTDWTAPSVTSDFHIIYVPLSINPTVDGIAIPVGTEIGVFYLYNGVYKLAGKGIWNGTNSLVLNVYGDDVSTIARDGMIAGETFIWKIRRNTSEEIDMNPFYSPIDATFTHTNTFAVNGISGLSALTGSSISVVAPNKLTGQVLSSYQVKLNFTDNSNNEDGFQILRSNISGSNFTTIALISANITEYIDETALAGNTYFYKVLAYKGNKKSDTSNEINVLMPISVSFTADNTSLLCGKVVEIPIKVNGFQGINGVRFTLNWDKNVVDLLEVSPSNFLTIDENNFDYQNAINGSFTFFWDNLLGSPASIPNDSTLFKLRFYVTGNSGINSFLSFSTINQANIISNGKGNQLNFIKNDAVLTIVAPSQSVTIQNVSSKLLCANTSIEVSYQTSEKFGTGNFFGLEISDANGSFSNPRNLIFWEGNESGKIQILIPNDLPQGEKYRIRIKATEPCYTSLDNGIDLRLIPSTNTSEIISINRENVKCFGERTGYAEVVFNCDIPVLRYEWSNGQTGKKNGSLGAGGYSVKIYLTETDIYTAFVSITQPNSLFISADIKNASTAGAKTGGINLVIQGGTQDYTVKWTLPNNTFITTEDLTNLEAGRYSVLVTDANGCQIKGDYLVSSPDVLLATSFVKNPDCQDGKNGSIKIKLFGGQKPYTYQWSTGQTTDSISGLSATVQVPYTVLIKDALNNSLKLDFNLTTPTGKPAISLAKTEYCLTDANPKITVTGVQNGKLQAEDGLVIDSTGTINLAKSLAGTYQIDYITNNESCKVTPINVTVYGLPFNQNKGKTIFACDSATLDARNTGATYLWNFGQTTQKITVFKDSTYIVKINMGACQITDTVKVKLSKTVLSVKTTEGDCTGAGGSAEITAKNGIGKYRYQWSHNANITSNKAENLPAGNYTVKVFDSLNCPKQITFEIKTPKLVSKVYNNRTVVDCNFTVLDLKNNGSLYKNKGKTTTQNPKITESGTYIFEIDNGECKILDTVNVRLSKLEVDVKQGNPLCVGVNSGSLKLTAKNGIGKTSIRWNDDQTPNLWLRENLPVGTYTALITDSVGCQISKTFVIESPAKALTAQAEVKGTIGCFGENNGEIRIIATGGLPPYSYSLNNQKVDSYIKNLANGIFLITVQDSNKCSFVLKVLMYQSDAMKINQIVKNSDCADSNNGSISIKINGGKSPYKVEFTHGVSTVLQENETFILDKLAPRPNVPYEALITDAVGCTQNISAKITVASRSKISVSAEKNSFCEGYGTDLIFKYEGKEKVFPFSVTYSNGKETKTLANQTDSLVRVKVVPTQNTIYSIEKLAYGNGCEGIVDKTTVNLSLNSLPALQNVLVLPVNCNSKDGQIIVDPKQIEKGKAPFYFSIDGKNFQESDTFKGLEVGTYTLLIKDQNACIYQYPQSLQIVDKPCGINPNAITNRFTPNNDGKNDTFEIPELRNYPDCMVTITDRNGIVVFKSDAGYPKAWDGTNNGAELPSLTTYYYTIELRKGNTKPIFGFVDLIK